MSLKLPSPGSKCDVLQIELIAEGWHGKVFLLSGKLGKLAVKTPVSPKFASNIKKEAQILRLVNKLGIGPRLLLEGEDFFVCEFIEGTAFDEFIESEKDPVRLKKVIFEVLRQARVLDKAGISKGEMHRPKRNVLIRHNLEVTLIDFERARFTKKPKNVTGFLSFVINAFKLRSEEFVGLISAYKRAISEDEKVEIFNNIIAKLDAGLSFLVTISFPR